MSFRPVIVPPPPAAETEPRPPSCERCQDTGIIRDGANARRCGCMAERDRAAARSRLLAEIPVVYRGCSRDAWKGAWPPGAPLAGARWWEGSWALFVHGRVTGSGKTHLATAVFLEAIEAGDFKSHRWVSTRGLLTEVTEEIAAKRERRVEQELRETDLLLLDDLGAERATDFARDVVTGILCHRYDWQLPTVVTSNADDLSDIDAFDPRLSSRLAHRSILIHRGGTDRRIPG